MGKILGVVLRFFRANKTLEFGFTERNRGLRACNLLFYFVQAIFHLLALDRVQALALPFGRFGGFGGGRAVSVHRPPGRNRRSRRRWRRHRWLGRFRRNHGPSLLPPEIVFVISRIDFYLAVADF